jgi:hypothetical protein
MHLGHHKALVREFQPTHEAASPGAVTLESKRQLLLQGQLDLNCAIRHSYMYCQWQKIITFLIRKDPHSSKIHRLSVIHLYGADLSLLLGVKWRSLTHYSLLHPGQFGGLTGRDAMTQGFLEELQWETSPASRRSLWRMDFVASSCFDRIIPNIASLAARNFGQHQTNGFILRVFFVRQNTS